VLRFILLGCLFFGVLLSADTLTLEQKIGRMLVVGFEGETLERNATILEQIRRYRLGGVILFDREFEDRSRIKNIRNPQQLKALTTALQSAAAAPLLIAVDQEGGRVARLKESAGFLATPSAAQMATLGVGAAITAYEALANMLHEAGINTDFAPVVDLAVNPQNRVIVGLERSYGAQSDTVSSYAGIFLDALEDHGVLGVLKHFPGHGSSLGDSHEGFVDVTKTWSDKELEPYRTLIGEGRVDMIMTAHVFNAKLDPKYPATLSYALNTDLLRAQLGFKGVIISDDMQMKAISANYGLKESVTLAINAGVDLLLFGNQLDHVSPETLVQTIAAQVRSGAISMERIDEANARIEALHVKRSFHPLPLDFSQRRVALTRDYIKEHYGLRVDDIAIDPKVIVLHWTAIPTLEEAYVRLKPELLVSDRKDISGAGTLNVSAHFLVDRDGTIYRLMNENMMARHVIGLNYSAIGIENVGGEGNLKEDLTEAQVEANVALVRYLKSRHPGIEYLIGHHEYRLMEKTPLWLERDSGYRTEKRDPGERFMRAVRAQVGDLHLKAPQ